MKVVFLGTPEYVVPVLEALQENFEVVGVVTSPDKPVGRKKTLTPSPVKAHFKGPVFASDKLDQSLADELKLLDPDLFVIASFGKIIPQNILNIPKHGSLNVHPSDLPKYRGASPIQTAILNGDESSAVSIIQLDEQVDHGPIVAKNKVELGLKDTFDSLSKEMFILGAKLLISVIPDFVHGKLKLKTQNHKQATFCKIIKKEDSFFDIDNPPAPEKLDRMIRAYSHWPNVWTRWNNKVVKFYPKNIVQLEGKKPTTLKNFLNGYPNFPIKKL